jgi:hypothetical protein
MAERDGKCLARVCMSKLMHSRKIAERDKKCLAWVCMCKLWHQRFYGREMQKMSCPSSHVQTNCMCMKHGGTPHLIIFAHTHWSHWGGGWAGSERKAKDKHESKAECDDVMSLRTGAALCMYMWNQTRTKLLTIFHITPKVQCQVLSQFGHDTITYPFHCLGLFCAWFLINFPVYVGVEPASWTVGGLHQGYFCHSTIPTK